MVENGHVNTTLAMLELDFPTEDGRTSVIVGSVTTSQSRRHLRNDDAHNVLYWDTWRWYGSQVPYTEEQRTCLTYILTLGVIDELRGRGIASSLVRQTIEAYRDMNPTMKAVYLHVITYNTAAIKLYEKVGFRKLNEYTSFYNFGGQEFNSFLYVFYYDEHKFLEKEK
eukprot:Trichotokara_eunicae@DN3649_c0_g1_i1.p1